MSNMILSAYRQNILEEELFVNWGINQYNHAHVCADESAHFTIHVCSGSGGEPGSADRNKTQFRDHEWLE